MAVGDQTDGECHWRMISSWDGLALLRPFETSVLQFMFDTMLEYVEKYGYKHWGKYYGK